MRHGAGNEGGALHRRASGHPVSSVPLSNCVAVWSTLPAAVLYAMHVHRYADGPSPALLTHQVPEATSMYLYPSATSVDLHYTARRAHRANSTSILPYLLASALPSECRP